MAKKQEEVKTAEVVEAQNALTTAPEGGALVNVDPFAATDGDSGFEDTTSEDYMIPRLKVLQGMSPQCTDGKPEFDERFRPGMLYNSVTEEAFSGKTGLYFIPCVYRRLGTLWDPEEQNRSGAFRGSVDALELDKLLLISEFIEKTGNLIKSGEHEGMVISDTREWWGLVSATEDFAEFTPILFSLASSQLKKSKKWLQMAQSLRVNGKPVKLWSQIYQITTAAEVINGNTISGTLVKHIGQVPSLEVFHEATSFREMVQGGVAKAVPEGGGDAGVGGDSPF
jgi:hypothetical protein